MSYISRKQAKLTVLFISTIGLVSNVNADVTDVGPSFGKGLNTIKRISEGGTLPESGFVSESTEGLSEAEVLKHEETICENEPDGEECSAILMRAGRAAFAEENAAYEVERQAEQEIVNALRPEDELAATKGAILYSAKYPSGKFARFSSRTSQRDAILQIVSFYRDKYVNSKSLCPAYVVWNSDGKCVDVIINELHKMDASAQ